jgi:hypothetical protein
MSDKKINRLSLSAEERRLHSRLHQLLSQAGGLLHGSLIEMARRCGNPRCRCASDDAHKHRSLYLGQTRGGKTTMEYVPKDQEQNVRRWAADFQRARDLLEAISQQGWRRLVESKAKTKAARKSAKKKAAGKRTAVSKSTKKTSAKKTPASKLPRKHPTRKPPPRSS